MYLALEIFLLLLALGGFGIAVGFKPLEDFIAGGSDCGFVILSELVSELFILE